MEVRARARVRVTIERVTMDRGSSFRTLFRQQSPVSSSVAYEMCCNVTEAEDHSCGGNHVHVHLESCRDGNLT